MRFFLLLLLGTGISACSSTSHADQRQQRIAARKAIKTASVGTEAYGSKKRPIRFYFTPSVESKMIENSGKVLIDFLTRETNLHYEMYLPGSYDEMIDAFGDDRAHVAMMNSLSYVRAHRAHGARAVLKSVRYNSPNYFGQIIAHIDSGIETIEDITGRSMVYTDSSSGSGFLYPLKMLQSKEVQPATISFAGRHDRVVEIVYGRVAEAGATFYSEPDPDGTIRDARARLLDKYPDIAEKIRIVAITEPIPNDPVVFHQDIPRQMQFDISLALVKFLATEEGQDAMGDIYSIQGYVRCSDKDYDGLREALAFSEQTAL